MEAKSSFVGKSTGRSLGTSRLSDFNEEQQALGNRNRGSCLLARPPEPGGMGEESPFGSKSGLQLEPKTEGSHREPDQVRAQGRSSGLRTGSRTSRKRSSARAASGGSLPTTTGGSGKLRTWKAQICSSLCARPMTRRPSTSSETCCGCSSPT